MTDRYVVWNIYKKINKILIKTHNKATKNITKVKTMSHKVELSITFKIKEKKIYIYVPVRFSRQKEYPRMTLGKNMSYFDQILSTKLT